MYEGCEGDKDNRGVSMRFAKVGRCGEVTAMVRASREDARRERWVWEVEYNW